MNIWFARANGDSGHHHSDPGSLRYVKGQPQPFPPHPFNYRLDCLRDGFLRIGMPATGDLRQGNWRETARRAYGEVSADRARDLDSFAKILTGDLAILPADRGQFDVHLGVVVRRGRGTGEIVSTPGYAAYYHYYNLPSGDWFENAHRVDVQWSVDSAGKAKVFHLPELGGIWRRWFSRVVRGRDSVIRLAHDVGLLSAVGGRTGAV
jgi:hypothetical protein